MAIALSLEIDPVLQASSLGASSSDRGPFDYTEPSSAAAPFRVAHNTPLVAKLPSFAQCADALRMHPTTASILDDMRFLIAAVLALPPAPDAKDLQKVRSTADWIHGRIQRLPADSPDAADEEPAEQPLPADARRPSIVLSQAAPVAPEAASGGGAGGGAGAGPARPRQASASPRLLASAGGAARHQSTSTSPHLQPQALQQQQPLPPPPAAGAAGATPGVTSRHARRNSAQSARSARSARSVRSASGATTAATTPSLPAPDPLYQAVRQTALVYTRAVLQRRPFSEVVDPAEFVQLWTSTWRVSLTAWKGLLGVFMWAMLAIVASGRGTAHDLFVKSMLSICTVQASLESWDVAVGALRAAVRLNRWLAGGRTGATPSAGGSGRRRGPRQERHDRQDLQATQQDRESMPAGVAGGFTAEDDGMRDGGATLPGWNP